MTDKFVKHPKCHQMFLYATEQLQKPFAVAVMDESLAWQQTNIGFKIGNPVTYIFTPLLLRTNHTKKHLTDHYQSPHEGRQSI